MAKIIWKFPFEVTDVIDLEMPRGAQVLAVQVQHRQPCVWALVDDTKGKEIRHFRCFGTGHPINTEGQFVGTFQLLDGDFIGHLFEV